ncbi:MAG: PHP domain-containing protein [Treponema sp.]
MIDLHTHSTASDGTFSPSALAALAAQVGVSVLALTDHDTVAGIAEAEAAGKEYGVTIVPGIEISVAWEPGELHLLGLGIDTQNDAVQRLIRFSQEQRNIRNEIMAGLFKSAGLSFDMQRLTQLADGAVIGRPHFAQYLIELKKAKNIQDAFHKYLAKGRPFYVKKECVSLAEAITAVRSAHGVPVLAHPMSLYLSWSKLPAAIESFKKEGLLGIEAWHSSARKGECVRLEKLAQSLNLLVTAGSDFHGSIRKDRKLGRTVCDMPIEDRFYTEQLLPALKNARMQEPAAAATL